MTRTGYHSRSLAVFRVGAQPLYPVSITAGRHSQGRQPQSWPTDSPPFALDWSWWVPDDSAVAKQREALARPTTGCRRYILLRVVGNEGERARSAVSDFSGVVFLQALVCFVE